MIDASILIDLFPANLIDYSSDKYGRSFVMLKESDSGARLKRVNVFDVDKDSILLKIDKTDPPNTLFQSRKGVCKRCDYVLITEYNKQRYLVFIELKSASKVPEKRSKSNFGALNALLTTAIQRSIDSTNKTIILGNFKSDSWSSISHFLQNVQQDLGSLIAVLLESKMILRIKCESTRHHIILR